MGNTDAHREMVFSPFQKSFYETQGRDKCKLCGERLQVGDQIVRKFNSSRSSLYHKKCYFKWAIHID